MNEFEINKVEKDTIGEIGNISMGNAATTLSMMVNHTVNITTPKVELVSRKDVLNEYEKTCIFVQIHYIKGLTGNNVFILKEPDVMCMTDLMMGGTGAYATGEMGELQLSAISEAMNQMMGTSATSMAVMMGFPVDISTPELTHIDVDSVKAYEKMFNTNAEAELVRVSFKMDIEDLIHSTMVQIYPIEFAREMCEKFKENKATVA